MKLYNVFKANMDYGPDSLLKSFTSKELAEKMVELYEKYSYFNYENEYYIEETEAIDSFEDEIFTIKTIEYFTYNGKDFHERSLNSLRNHSGSWGEFLEGNYYAMDSFHITHELISEHSDERQVTLNLHLHRPKGLGEEAIKKEWNGLMHHILMLYEGGINQDQINELLKNKKLQSVQ